VIPTNDEVSSSYYSTNPNRTLLVFVHGFRGKATETWTDFPALLPEQPRFSGFDILYYGYDGERATSDASGNLFSDVLDGLFSDPLGLAPAALRNRLARPPSFGYDRCILVAHSLGAVVSRRALLTAEQRGKPWVSRCHLVLFAPAHLGSPGPEQLAAATSALPSFFSLLAQFRAFNTPPLTDLKIDSVTLKNLLQESRDSLAAARSAAPQAKPPHLVAARVVWAEQDPIVVNARFLEDPPGTPMAGRNHIDVCKPTRTFPIPIAQLVAALDEIER
jgi:pimeloyl-ACP methyl ester carboxylesterase